MEEEEVEKEKGERKSGISRSGRCDETADLRLGLVRTRRALRRVFRARVGRVLFRSERVLGDALAA